DDGRHSEARGVVASGRLDVVIKTPVFVVDEKQRGLRPRWAGSYRVDCQRRESLAPARWRRGALGEGILGDDPGDRGQATAGSVGQELLVGALRPRVRLPLGIEGDRVVPGVWKVRQIAAPIDSRLVQAVNQVGPREEGG